MAQALNLIKKIMDQTNPLSTLRKANEGPEGKDGLSSSHSFSQKDFQTLETLNGSLGAFSSNKPSPFAERVRESHAKLNSKNKRLKNEPRNTAESKAKLAEKKISQANEIKNQGHKNDLQKRSVSETKTKATDSNTHEKGSEKSKEIDTAAPSTQNSRSEEISTEAERALKDRLEKLGIVATDEQLTDPNFLKDMLQFIQGISTQTQGDSLTNGDNQSMGLELESAQNFGQTKSTSQTLTERQESEMARDILTPDAIENSESTTRSIDPLTSSKELETLIQDRLAEIKKNEDVVNGAGIPNSAAARIQNAKLGQEIQLYGSEDTTPLDSIPSSDLDKLRVLQAVGLRPDSQAGASHESFENNGDENQEIEKFDTLHAIADSSPADLADSEMKNSDQFNQSQSPAQGGGSNGSITTAQGGKDGIVGAQFHQALENMKSTDAKNGSEPLWAPQRTAFEQSVLQQISKKISTLTQNHGGQISLQLEPENLGKIRIGMGLKEGIMTAHISVENDKIKEIVDANLPQLRETLENQGIKLQSLDVAVDQHHSSLFNPDGTNSQGFFQGRGQGSKGQNLNEELQNTSGLEIVPESDTGRRLGYNTLEYIG